MAITIPTSASLGSRAAEIATNNAARGDFDTAVANAVVALATETSAALLTSQAVIPVNLAGAILAAGTPMAAWADNASSNPGITLADVVTFVVTAFFQTVGALHDADSDCGGSTSAMTGDATSKTVAELTLTIAAVDVPPSPSKLSFSIKPASLGTDDVIVSSAWFEYTRKALAS